MKTFIYSISDEKGRIRYIGKSKNPKNRLNGHIREKSNLHKFNWIGSIINRGFYPIVEILDEVPEEEWQFWEKYWISQFKQWGFKLLNISEGGDGINSGHKFSKKTLMKMRKAKLGIKLSLTHKSKISKSVKQKSLENPNYNRSGDNLKKPIDRDVLYNFYIIENLSISKISEKLKCSEKKVFDNLKDYGFKKDKSIWRKQCSSKELKSIYLISESGEIIKNWDSIELASSELGINRSLISSRCRNNYKSDGYIWSYNPKLNKNTFGRSRKISQYDLNGNLVGEFTSIKQASECGFNQNNIQDCCVGRLKSHGGFIWRYSEDSPPNKYSIKTIKKVTQFSMNMNFIKEWNSIALASKSLGIGSNSITTCCKGKYKSSGGFIWRYT
jgi:hypothetical protein